MMVSEKRVIVFRHGEDDRLADRDYMCWSINAHLSYQGQQQIREIVRKHKELLANCSVFATSPIIRAQESLFTMMNELNYAPAKFDNVWFMSELMAAVSSVWCTKNMSETVSDVWRRNPEGVEAEGKHIFNGICRVADMLNDGENALCVSHGGPLNAGCAFAKDYLRTDVSEPSSFENIRDLGKGEGAVFVFEEEPDGDLIWIEKLRNE